MKRLQLVIHTASFFSAMNLKKETVPKPFCKSYADFTDLLDDSVTGTN